MEFKTFPKAMAITAVVTFGVGLSFAQDVEIATWSGFRKGAASFTFDDGAPSSPFDDDHPPLLNVANRLQIVNMIKSITISLF